MPPLLLYNIKLVIHYFPVPIMIKSVSTINQSNNDKNINQVVNVKNIQNFYDKNIFL